MRFLIVFGIIFLTVAFLACNRNSYSSKHEQLLNSVWSQDEANDWYRNKGWMAGCNYTPSYAVNQLELWQHESFDTSVISRELGWAHELGFNLVRVYLHDLLWRQDSSGFINRINQFLAIAHRHNIGTMLVLFDGVWNPFPKVGKQPDPVPFVHNSGWVQSPSNEMLSDTSQYKYLENYIKGILSQYKDDQRVIMWDLYNEPDNDNGGRFPNGLSPHEKYKYSFILLKKSFEWAREINPSQPLTAAPWKRDWSDADKMDSLDKYMFDHSDVISFHCYDSLSVIKAKIESLKRYNRPLICSEYMARPQGSTFKEILPFLKEQNVSALNWGFVDGKTQTIYPWDSWFKKYSSPPKVWFHDILHKDGSTYDSSEVSLIKALTAK